MPRDALPTRLSYFSPPGNGLSTLDARWKPLIEQYNSGIIRGDTVGIEAIKQSEIWKTPRWWIFFAGLIIPGFVIATVLGLVQGRKQLSRTRQQYLQWAELDIEDEQFVKTQRLRTQAPGPHGPSH